MHAIGLLKLPINAITVVVNESELLERGSTPHVIICKENYNEEKMIKVMIISSRIPTHRFHTKILFLKSKNF